MQIGRRGRFGKLCVLSSWAASAALSGCGGSGTGDGTAGSATGDQVELSELVTVYPEVYCSWLYRCCPSAQLEHLGEAQIAFTGNSEDECRTNMAALMALLTPIITEGEGQGRESYDPVAAGDCMELLRTSCADPEQNCESVTQPLVPTGGACSQDSHCIDGACIGGATDRDGVCGPLLALGEACEIDDDCVSQVCDGSICVEKAADGETCYDDSTCASGYCDYGTNQCAAAPYTNACNL